MKSEKTNKKWIISLSILTGIVFVLSISLLTLTLNQYSSKQAVVPTPTADASAQANTQASDSEDSSAEKAVEEIYIIKNYQGKIGIFIKGDENPFQILDIDPSLLPEKDQEELSEGLEIKGAENLRQIIEDFDG